MTEKKKKHRSPETPGAAAASGRKRSLAGRIVRLLLLFAVLLAVAAAAVIWFAGRLLYQQPVPLTPEAAAQSTLSVSIPYGSSPRRIARLLRDAGVDLPEELLYRWLAHQSAIGRISSISGISGGDSGGDSGGGGSSLHAGYYEFTPAHTVQDITRMMTDGKHPTTRFTIIEGWTFRQIQAALAEQKDLKQTLAGKTPEQVLKALNIQPPYEGRFAPLTYTVSKHSSDADLLKQAAAKMDELLDAAWQTRSSNSQLKNREQLRIMASLIEKETGQTADMPNISAVFNNRLRTGMLLQTDPTVIYGMGEKYDGNIRRKDLQTDTPWNTYTRAGLPPTPIATAGKAAIQAAASPPESAYFYFVSKGNGFSYFGRNLKEHNRAVQHYILKRGAEPVQH